MTELEERTIREALLTLPRNTTRAKAIVALDQIKATSSRRSNILKLVQEALSQLRLDMKYLIFDLEATRREREEYKARCGE